MGDIRKFSMDMDNFAKKVGIAAEILQKRVAFDLFGRIVKKTPVDKGRARGSWTIAVNAADRAVLPEGQESYPEPKIGSLTVKPGDEIWISNNLPYIVELEKGHSKKAPEGMVALSIAEVDHNMSRLEQTAVKEAGL